MRRFLNIRFRLLAVSAALFAFAATGPRLPLRRDAHDVVAVVDITGSMNVRDYRLDGRPASRLEFARVALIRLLAAMPCQSRFGLAVFSERRPFLLFEPAETCGNFAALSGAVESLDWRMAWEGDSHVAAGLYRSLDMAGSLGASLLFISDGQEAPPLPAAGPPAFAGKPGEVAGLIVGAGGFGLSPIPKFDDEGREIGFYAAEDVPHDNRVGLAPKDAGPKDAGLREGWNERNAPFGAAAATGTEHLSSLRQDHLASLAAATGLAYARLDSADGLAPALFAAVRPRRLEVPTEVGVIPAALALALIVAAYGPSIISKKGRPTMKRLMLMFAMAFLFSGGASAHGPTPQRAEERIAVAAPPAAVWAVIRDFHGLAAWHPLVAQSDGAGGDAPGAERQVVFKGGGVLTEGLDDYDAAGMSYGYRLSKENIEAFPVSFYTAAISVKPAPGGSEVEWIGRFYRADTTNEPPEHLNDEAAVRAMSDFMRAGLQGLKGRAESGGRSVAK
jgi:hypothetical protein